MTELPTILNRSDIDRNFPNPCVPSVNEDEMWKRIEEAREGKRVRVIGKYTQVDMRQRPKPPPVYRGHVALILAEGTAEGAKVYLHPTWHPDAPRSAEEITRYDNRMVAVVGKLVPDTPESPIPEAYITGPCLLTIDSIDFWKPE